MTQNTQTRAMDETLIPIDKADPDHLNAAETDDLREKLEVALDDRLRLAAEYKNYRRRTEQTNAEAADKGKQELLLQLVSLADDLDRALAGLNESPQAAAEGVRMIHRRFHDISKLIPLLLLKAKV